MSRRPPGASAPEPGRRHNAVRRLASGVVVYAWSDQAVLGLGLVALASGLGQFGAVAALGDVAHAFGHMRAGASVADQAGLSGTALGVGLAVIRLASLGGLPVAGAADRLGRRRVLLGAATAGLACTALAAVSPSYWSFVVIFACGRPLLSAANALAGVMAAEETDTGGRAKAIALVAGAYAAGGGITALVHSATLGGGGFRVVCLLALAPLVGLVFVRRLVREPDRFAVLAARGEHPLPVLGAVGRVHRRRLGVVALISFALSLISGPGNSFVFLYAQNIVHLSGALTAAMVVTAGAAGLGGLVAGRALADRAGRRPAAAVGMCAVALFAVLAYSGSAVALFVGYVLGVVAGALLAPGIGALTNELFPTAVRASVAGWVVAAGVLGAATGMVVFGAVADVETHFGLAALVTFVPAALAAAAFALLPETRGREPEELVGERGGGPDPREWTSPPPR